MPPVAVFLFSTDYVGTAGSSHPPAGSPGGSYCILSPYERAIPSLKTWLSPLKASGNIVENETFGILSHAMWT